MPGLHAGGILTLSSNQQAFASGLVWAILCLGDANTGEVNGQLSAYPVAQGAPFWTSGAFSLGKFTAPTVAHDRVFVATHQGKVITFGLRTQRVCESATCGFHNNTYCGDCAGGQACSNGSCINNPCASPGACGVIDGIDCGQCGVGAACDGNRCIPVGCDARTAIRRYDAKGFICPNQLKTRTPTKR